MSTSCVGCGANSITQLADLGPQPPSNRFLLGPDERNECHSLKLGCCRTCGLAQLLSPMAIEMVRSRHAWITYNEPEGHLDRLVDVVATTAAITPHTRLIGLSYKDDSTLARFSKRGAASTYRLDPVHDLDIRESLAGLETLQAHLTAGRAKAVADRILPADIVVVRHILEHAHRPLLFLEACQYLAKPGGWLVFEVPDSRKMLDGQDHCFLWEEHISYFTPTTLTNLLNGAGFSDFRLEIYPYTMEDSLVVIVRNTRSDARPAGDIEREIRRAERFAGSLAERGACVRGYLRSLQSKDKKVAVFGAGHLSAKFINLYQLRPLIYGVVDDNANKQNLFMPGSALPIMDSSHLEVDRVELCLLTLNPESEERVVKAKGDYLRRGGRFRSIFSASTNSINLDLPHDQT